MELKIIAGIIAAFLPFVAYVPYVRETWTGKIKPHPFSWIIWAGATAITSVILLNTGGGWAVLRQFSLVVLCLIIAILAFVRKSHFSVRITSSDWLCLALAVIALTIYVSTNNSLVAMSFLILAEALALIPTIAKVRRTPFSESQFMWWIQSFVSVLAFVALASYNATTLVASIGGLLINFAGLAFIVAGQHRKQQKEAVAVEVENE